MSLNAQSKYPSWRTYVPKVRGDTDLVTGRQHEFDSGRELLDAIAVELEASGDGTAANG